MNTWTRPFEWKSAPAAPAGSRRASVSPQYFAFLSYSHQDSKDADWLHKELERFRVPSSLAGKLTSHGVIPRRLTPVFRDRHELAASGDLGTEISEALEGSHCLIVLCSPSAAASKWTNAEIELFKRLHPDGCIIAAIVAGEPFASETPGREQEECLPPALRRRYDRRGRPTGKRAEPLAADLRDTGDGRRLGFLKIVAGMLGVGLDELVQRDQLRRQRRLATITGASFLGMVAALLLAATAIEARDAARDQRREAEGLVAFMLGDLREKLEPIGRLDALDGVGSRVLEYYGKQDTSDLSDAALLQRSRALNLTAEVAYARGDRDGAQRLYRTAMAGTAEAIRRDPEDPKRIFEHAQNVFWSAHISRERGRAAEAEAGMREYKRLADQMVALEPNNMTWRMEQHSGDFNVGVLLFERRRFREAIAQFQRALAPIEALSTADPANTNYRVNFAEAQSWLADALYAEGQLEQAILVRERVVALLGQLLSRTNDIVYREKLVPAERRLGALYAFRGDTDKALTHFRAAADHSAALRAHEPTNLRWMGYLAVAHIQLGELLLGSGRANEAASATSLACESATRLVATDSNVQEWRAHLRDCWEARAQLGLAANNIAQARQFAERAVETAKSVRSSDPVDSRYSLAQSYRIQGDIRRKAGDTAGARIAWQSGIDAIPPNVAEKPHETAERVVLLHRLGRLVEAREGVGRLSAMGYRIPELRAE